ncbi:hypothetical protein BD310DRAFT_257839 [Dichomitus squalens]|uniref:F-box domain-containing protein n=1 Tax=Dichomitus squalens TaxID=114155 RepID=A0A4Q9PC48_9APHY|nr:hypothetical protein BD310DRAFT_257839 [Dichomitus squalens]
MDTSTGHTTTGVPALPLELVHLIMDELYSNSIPQDHCYRNQQTYRSWSLVCRAWRPYAQKPLFSIIELTDSEFLHRFATILDLAPHLASYVKMLRVYSRYLHTFDNVFALLPAALHTRLVNLRELMVTRNSEDDVWHPHALLPSRPDEMRYIPLSPNFFNSLCTLNNVTVFKLYWVSLERFSDLARAVHSLSNLQVLVCIQVHWMYIDDIPPFLSPVTSTEPTRFLPELSDLTLSFLDAHGTERLLSALRGSSLTKLYVDCPTYHSTTITPFYPVDLFTGRSIGVDLRHLPYLKSLWITIPYTLSLFPDLPEAMTSVIRSWVPHGIHGTRTLTFTATYEYDFTREEFVDVLRALGPVVEDVLLGAGSGDIENSGRQQEFSGIVLEVSVIDVSEKHDWWRDRARECFPKLRELGRLRNTFCKVHALPCQSIGIIGSGRIARSKQQTRHPTRRVPGESTRSMLLPNTMTSTRMASTVGPHSY